MNEPKFKKDAVVIVDGDLYNVHSVHEDPDWGEYIYVLEDDTGHIHVYENEIQGEKIR